MGRQSTLVRILTPEMISQLEEFRYNFRYYGFNSFRRRNKTKIRMDDKSPLVKTPSKKDSSLSLRSGEKLNSFEQGVIKTPINPIRKKPTFRNSTAGPGLWAFDTIKEDPSPKQDRKNEKEIEEDSFRSSSGSIDSSRRRKIKKKNLRIEKLVSKFNKEKEEDKKMQRQLSEFLKGKYYYFYF